MFLNDATDQDAAAHAAVRVLAEPSLAVDPHEFTRAINLNGSALLYLAQSALPVLQRGSTDEAGSTCRPETRHSTRPHCDGVDH